MLWAWVTCASGCENILPVFLAYPTKPLRLPAAVQFELPKAICVDYLCGQAQHMDALLNLAQLADQLGSSLLDTAAEILIALPWYKNMSAAAS